MNRLSREKAREILRDRAGAENAADSAPAAGQNTAENERRIERARTRWESAGRTGGAEDQITVETGETLRGHYELGEAGISTPSVDPEKDFTQHGDFPVNENGTSMNVGRDYTEGFAREAVERMAADFDQRGEGIVVDENGVTASGNNRDISRRVAARKGTDGKYTAYLQSRPERWGFTPADIARYRHPTLYFVTAAPAVYTPRWFDRFNRSGAKSLSPVDNAVKMSYLVDRDMVNEFSAALREYETIGDLYEDVPAATGIFKSLLKRGIVTENVYPEYVETIRAKGKPQEHVTSGGKDFLESVMLGAVLDEDSIRTLALVPKIRGRLVNGLAALVDNAALGEYGVIPEINQAVTVAAEVQTNPKKYKSITDYAGQSELDLGQRVSTDIEIELASRLLERNEYGFADMAGGLNAVLREERLGQGDLFSSTGKDDILRRYLNVKARVDAIRSENDKIIGSKSATAGEKTQAALENAGLAKTEQDGTRTLFSLEEDGEHPAAALVKRALRIADAAERRRVVRDIADLYDRYAGTAAEYQAPNGKPSLLLEALGEEQGKQAWYAVRTPGFKEWFGDWERLTDMEFPGRAWPENFPDVAVLSTQRTLEADRELYDAAKGGSREAADNLIHGLMGQEQQEAILRLAGQYPDAVIVPVTSEEQNGNNQIPWSLAEYMGEITGLEVDRGIVQVQSAGRTGSGRWHRFAFRPRFDGKVQPGRKYIVVDDNVTMGGSLSEMRRFIERNGGEAVQFVTLGKSYKGTNETIALQPETLRGLIDKYGREELSSFLKEIYLYGGHIEALTNPEGEALLQAANLYAARSGILAAKAQGRRRSQPEVV